MRERQRFYRAIVTSATGRRFTISFRGDNLQLAHDHAEHCCLSNDYSVEEVRYIGTAEPTGDFGVFKELP